MFVEEVMDLVELNPLRNSVVGLPGVDGLSTEQRKRLTTAVELVANPSIIFMDEPTFWGPCPSRFCSPSKHTAVGEKSPNSIY